MGSTTFYNSTNAILIQGTTVDAIADRAGNSVVMNSARPSFGKFDVTLRCDGQAITKHVNRNVLDTINATVLGELAKHGVELDRINVEEMQGERDVPSVDTILPAICANLATKKAFGLE